MTDEIHSPRSNPHADHVSVLPRQVYIDTCQVTVGAKHAPHLLADSYSCELEAICPPTSYVALALEHLHYLRLYFGFS